MSEIFSQTFKTCACLGPINIVKNTHVVNIAPAFVITTLLHHSKIQQSLHLLE